MNASSIATLSPQPGYAERDMHALWTTCAETISRLLKQTHTPGKLIRGVGISAQGKGLFLLDKQDQPLGTAILSSDRRALDIVRRWQQDGIPQKLYPHTRQTLWTGHPASLLRWVKENEPQRYAADWLRDDGARLSALVPDRRQGLRREQYLRIQSLQHGKPALRRTIVAVAGYSAKLTPPCRRLSVPPKSAGKSPLRQPP